MVGSRLNTDIVFLSGKCYEARITLHMIGAASCLSIYLYLSRAEVLLMASNISYLSVYRISSASLYCVHALFVAYERLAVLVPDLGCEGSTLLCFN
jgi:hypothetical protein